MLLRGASLVGKLRSVADLVGRDKRLLLFLYQKKGPSFFSTLVMSNPVVGGQSVYAHESACSREERRLYG